MRTYMYEKAYIRTVCILLSTNLLLCNIIIKYFDIPVQLSGFCIVTGNAYKSLYVMHFPMITVYGQESLQECASTFQPLH